MEYVFNKAISQMLPSKTVDLMNKGMEMRAKGIDVVSLSVGEPDFNTPMAASYAGITAICDNKTHYTESRGILPLRRRLAKKLKEDNGIDCNEINILVTPSAKFALYIAIRTMVNPGDEVMLLDPSWVSYAQMVVAAAAVPVSVPLSFENNYTITREALESVVSEKSRLLILCTPNNPTGKMLTMEEAKILADFANEHNIMIISDEIYEKLVYDGNRHLSIASLPEVADRVITINGFSKCAAMTGWRIGYLVANEVVLKQIYMFYNHTMTCIPAFSQEAALAVLDCEKELQIMRDSFCARRNYLVNELRKLPGVTCHMPQGTFYCWVKMERNNMNSDQLADYLLEKAKVICVPGTAFGAGSEKCLRMSYAVPQAHLEEAIARFKKVL